MKKSIIITTAIYLIIAVLLFLILKLSGISNWNIFEYVILAAYIINIIILLFVFRKRVYGRFEEPKDVKNITEYYRKPSAGLTQALYDAAREQTIRKSRSKAERRDIAGWYYPDDEGK